ncbi:hypothetical protein FYK55_25785 [Roseiconus nitratireducens]|uniref:Uncharacterized protein n=1 Tax=Roseiconus nitratireducens TaxID=2605748 RepID=A0A5M6CX91_9BACT|nr:hypothetical protein [Roseiconus nitratireducens]KAA5539010.1 hypothetical protein FYK55_25785 [Roseiconus nitratireducens]
MPIQFDLAYGAARIRTAARKTFTLGTAWRCTRMDFSKLSPAASDQRRPDPEDHVEAIIVVKVADYVPKGISVRSQIDRTMFTTKATQAQIDALQRDDKVKSVQTSERLRVIAEQSKQAPSGATDDSTGDRSSDCDAPSCDSTDSGPAERD